MNNDEILLIQNYLRDLFDNEDISIRKEQDIPPSASLYVFSESIGSIQKDDDPDEEDISYSLTIPIDIPISDSQGLESNIQSMSKKKKIIISDRGSIEDSKEVSILNSQNEEEFLGVIFRDNDASCTFSVSILDFDL
ncbi:MAG: DUF3126 family protein [Pseudomonadota bacterium]|jgi:hypothetical protein|nr:DUF3126 family protein [Pseudomonadota bacterium]|tara:strand:- start:2769 stop:3179 length:411 start_codon:yes stop_codon:yes gene_type:complete